MAIIAEHSAVYGVLSDAPIIECPQHVQVDQQTLDDHQLLSLSCDVESYPASTVRWRCCGLDRDIPDSLLYEKACTENSSLF